MNLDLLKVLTVSELLLRSFVGVSSCWPGSSKSYVHCEVEVHSLYQRLLKTLRKAYTPRHTSLLVLHAYSSFV